MTFGLRTKERGCNDRWLFTTPNVLRRREKEMDLKLPFASAMWQPIWKRRRSERGPISIAVRALLELPDTIVEEILRLVDTGRYLEDGYGFPFFRGIYRGWAGNQRANNRQNLVDRFWRPSSGSNSPMDHLFALQFPQPLVY